MSEVAVRLTKEEKAENLCYNASKGKKLIRLVKRNRERAMKARSPREKTMVGRAFEKGIHYGMGLQQAKVQQATKDLTYE